jgi:predicted heme/steroid binding protein
VEHLREISTMELSARDGVNSKEVWIAYKGLVYDVTRSELFAGGKHYQHRCGRDLSNQIGKAPHLDDVLKEFEVVGVLKSLN